MTARAPLRLLAEDADDLEIISAALQDAVTRIGDISWERGARRLTIAFNRFRWEAAEGRGERVRAGFQIGGVQEVRARNLRAEAKDAVLEAPGHDLPEAGRPVARRADHLRLRRRRRPGRRGGVHRRRPGRSLPTLAGAA